MNESLKNKFIPLSKVVAASIIDMWEDIGKAQEVHTHWAARGYRELHSHSLRTGVRRVVLPVNRNLHTATLPCDCDEVMGVYTLNGNQKTPLRKDDNLVPISEIDTIQCEDVCEKCGSDKDICDHISIKEEVVLRTINGTVYEETRIKKLYPNGDYFLEVSKPYLNTETQEVDFNTTKEFVAKFDLKSCGCLEPTEENIYKLKVHCHDVYCNYYMPCSKNCMPDNGTYKVLGELGIIQFDYGFRDKNVFVVYRTFLTKINGAYHVPAVAFETLVAWTKWMAVDGKKSEPLSRIQWRKNEYVEAKRNMRKVIHRVSLNAIIDSVTTTPKFDFSHGINWYNNFCGGSSNVSIPVTKIPEVSIPSTPSTTVIRSGMDVAFEEIGFQVGTFGSLMVVGQTELVINDPDIIANSISVNLDSVALNGAFNDELKYTVNYESDKATLTFSEGAVENQKYLIRFMKKVNSSIGSAPVIPSETTGTTSQVIYVGSDLSAGEVSFQIGDPGAPMAESQTQLVINDENIIRKSVTITLDRQNIDGNFAGQIGYLVSYYTDHILIKFTEAAQNGQKYNIKYSKKITT